MDALSVVDELLIGFLAFCIGFGVFCHQFVGLSLDAIGCLLLLALGFSLSLAFLGCSCPLCLDTSLALFFCRLMSAGCTLLLNDGTIIALAIVAIVSPWFWIIDFEVLGLQLFNLIDELLLVLPFSLNFVVYRLRESFSVIRC